LSKVPFEMRFYQCPGAERILTFSPDVRPPLTFGCVSKDNRYALAPR
jgi:hypothetical protein